MVKPGNSQCLALVDLGKKFPKVRVDVLSSGSKNTRFEVWQNQGHDALNRVYLIELGPRMVHTHDFEVVGTRIAVFAMGMEEGPSQGVELAVYGVF